MPFEQPFLNTGSFVPTTNIWDVAQIYEVDVDSPEFKELLVRLYQNVNNIALSLNTKDAAYYQLSEFVNGQLYFPNPALLLQPNPAQTPTERQVYRTVVDFGALPNATTKSVAHGISTIDATWSFTRIYGCASNQTSLTYIPIPYVSTSALNQNIELNADATNVNITSGIDRTSYNVTYVVLEYIKQ